MHSKFPTPRAYLKPGGPEPQTYMQAHTYTNYTQYTIKAW